MIFRQRLKTFLIRCLSEPTQSINQSINQSKQISIAPCVASESFDAQKTDVDIATVYYLYHIKISLMMMMMMTRSLLDACVHIVGCVLQSGARM